jgi:SAM-dependent methyltransferase
MTINRHNLRGPVPLVHAILQQNLEQGAHVLDATCGNGKDTILLAGLVGQTGHVWACDIQEEAVNRTIQRLAEAGFLQRATVLHISHEMISEQITSPLNAVVFNLGWLPGGDKAVMTLPETTLKALDACLSLLADHGILAVTCYPGHAGGDLETEAVLEWASSLPPGCFYSWKMSQQNVAGNAPFCLIIQRSGVLNAD